MKSNRCKRKVELILHDNKFVRLISTIRFAGLSSTFKYGGLELTFSIQKINNFKGRKPRFV